MGHSFFVPGRTYRIGGLDYYVHTVVIVVYGPVAFTTYDRNGHTDCGILHQGSYEEWLTDQES